MDAVNLDAMLARFAEHWSPKKIAQVNDYDIRIAKIQGEFDKILIITHLADLRDLFPVRIEVTKTPAGSVIEVN